MKVVEKIDLAKAAVNSISRHDDAEKEYVLAALAKVKEHVDSEIVALEARRAEKWSKELAKA